MTGALVSSQKFPFNVTGMRQVYQPTSSVFPLEAPPIHYNFNSTQYKKQLKELETTHNTPFGSLKAKPGVTLSPQNVPKVELQVQS